MPFFLSLYKSPKLIYILLPFSIFIDCLNGYTQFIMNIHLPIGIIYRAFILILLLPCLFAFKATYIDKLIKGIILLFFFSIPIWCGFYGADLIKEFDSFIKILYPLIIIAYFNRFGKYFSQSFLIRIVSNYGFIISLLLIFSFITGITIYSYGDDYGFGVKFFFIAGNDLGLTMVLSLIFNGIACRNGMFFPLIRLICVYIGCFLIGSRVGMLGGTALMCYFGFYYFLIHRSQTTIGKCKKIFFFISLIVLFIWLGIPLLHKIYDTFDSYTLDRLTIEGLSSARDLLTDAAKIKIGNFDACGIFIGEGNSVLYKTISNYVGSSSEYRSVEADFYDCIGSYGFLLGGLILFCYIIFIIRSGRAFSKNMTYLNGSILIMCILFIGAAIFAGHAIRNSMSAPIYAIGLYLITCKNENPTNKQQLSDR